MRTALFVVGYVTIAAVAWVRLYIHLYRDHRREFPTLEWDSGDRLFGVLWGGLVCTFWPLFGPVGAFAWLVTRPAVRRSLECLERLERPPTPKPPQSRRC